MPSKSNVPVFIQKYGWLPLVVITLTGFVLWKISSILAPFIVAFIVGYILNPLVNILCRTKLPRSVAALIIILGFIVLFLGAIIVFIPSLIDEIGALRESLPQYIDNVRAMSLPWFEHITGHPLTSSVFLERTQSFGDNLLTTGGKAFELILAGTGAVTTTIMYLIVVPFVAFFVMRNWQDITHLPFAVTPPRHHDGLHRTLARINTKMSAYLRGQLFISLSLGVFYFIGLTIVGVKGALLLGLLAAVFTLVPMLGGVLMTTVVTFTTAAQLSFDNITPYIGLAVIFVLGYVLENYILTPQLMGKNLNIHPVTILIVLALGGSIGGIVGMIIAMPLAAIGTVIVPVMLLQWRKTKFYGDSSI